MGAANRHGCKKKEKMLQRLFLSTLSTVILLISTGCVIVETTRNVKEHRPNTTISVAGGASIADSPRLAVVWSSSDIDVAHRTCLAYVENAVKNKWFAEVTLIVWGPSVKLLADDDELRAKIELLMEAGTKVYVSVTCAETYDVGDKLVELGVTLKPVGKLFTDLLNSENTKVITF
jgi:hypothetical protein